MARMTLPFGAVFPPAALVAGMFMAACLPEAQTALPQGGVDVSLPPLPTRPDTVVGPAESRALGAADPQVAILSVNPVQLLDDSYGYAELVLGCRDGVAALALSVEGQQLRAGAEWFAGGATGQLAMTAAPDGLLAPPGAAAFLSELSGRRVEFRAIDDAGRILAVQFELSDLRTALARLPCSGGR